MAAEGSAAVTIKLLIVGDLPTDPPLDKLNM